MKRFILTMFLAVGSLAVFSATGNAQVNRRYSANIPFDFSVGKKQFKAGDYVLGPIGTNSSADFLLLTNRSTGKVQLIGQVSVGSHDNVLKGKLYFVQTADGWTLSSIETGTFLAEFHGDRGDQKIASNRGTSGNRSVAVQ
jgi:hypothetical protein